MDLEKIQIWLNKNQPELTIYPQSDGSIDIVGNFILYSEGAPYDSYKVKISVPSSFPAKAPKVREVGERIPRIPDRHINPDGTACLYVPDEEYKFLTSKTELTEFLDNTIRCFFYSQTHFEKGGNWPFGERSHGILGIFEYYKELTDIDTFQDLKTLLRLSLKKKLRPWYICFCGKKITQCEKHKEVTRLIRKTVKHHRLKQNFDEIRRMNI